MPAKISTVPASFTTPRTGPSRVETICVGATSMYWMRSGEVSTDSPLSRADTSSSIRRPDPTPRANAYPERTEVAWSAAVGDPADAADAVVTPPVEDVQRVPDGHPQRRRPELPPGVEAPWHVHEAGRARSPVDPDHANALQVERLYERLQLVIDEPVVRWIVQTPR